MEPTGPIRRVYNLFRPDIRRVFEEYHRREATECISRSAQNFYLISVDVELQELNGFGITIQNDIVTAPVVALATRVIGMAVV
jgi:hypothetical protein